MNQHIQHDKLIVLVGSGGVGKTTTAASVALGGALSGRRVLVITIDPARRLMNALGLSSPGNTASVVDLGQFMKGNSADQPLKGSLSALMLDTSSAFRELLEQIVHDAPLRERILDNRIFKQVSRAFTSTQEVMAIEKLHQHYESGDFDLIVLDTPPMKNALDFLEAPEKLSRFFDRSIVGWFMQPAKGSGSIARRLLASTGAATYKLLAYMFGHTFVGELNDFFMLFQGTTDGFQSRSIRMGEILREPMTSFMVVCSTEQNSVEDCEHFVQQLSSRHLPFVGAIVNRVGPIMPQQDSMASVLSEAEKLELEALMPGIGALRAVFDKAYRRDAGRSRREQSALERLKQIVGSNRFRKWIPELEGDINSVSGLRLLAGALCAE